jgi:HPt (histidine-containing phosphotransfer) domain-containing protein
MGIQGGKMNFKQLGENLGLEEDEYRELVELFVQTGLSDYANLKQGVDTDNVEMIVQASHTIAGAAGNLGLLDMHKVAKQIELQAGKNEKERRTNDVQELKLMFDEIAEFVAG